MDSKQKPDLKRLEALRRLPKKVLSTLSQDEVNAFLHKEIWPDSLRKKLEDYISD